MAGSLLASLRRPFPSVAGFLLMMPLWASDAPEVAARPIEVNIQVDGAINEIEWRDDPAIGNLIQVEPRAGEPPTEATKVSV